MKNFSRVFFTVLSFFFFTLLPTNNDASAATVYVNSGIGNDTSGDGSSGSPYKTFHKGYTMTNASDILDLTGTFTWTDADEIGDASTSGYTISKDITIQGQGANQTIVRAASSEGAADRRVFTVPLGNTVSINSLTVRYGNLSSQNGAGIYIDGVATIDYCDISYNRVLDGSGGGVDVRGSLTIQNSTIHHNVAHYMGGGLNRNYYSGSGGVPGGSDLLDIINCTISYNQVTQTVAYLEGGGVFFRRGQGSITNSTIAYNQIVNGAGTSTHGVGTGDAGSIVRLKNNIIAENTLTNIWSGEIGHRSSGGGTFTDNGGNIIGKMGYYSDGFSVATTTWVDQVSGSGSVDGTYILQDGGSTNGQLNLNSALALNSSLHGSMTHAITAGTSVAVNNGLTGVNGSVSVPSADQRGAARNGSTDIGAYEYAGVFGPPIVDSLSPADNSIGIGVTVNLIITFDEAVDAESGNIVIKKTSDNSTVETIGVTSGQVTGTGTTTITINPASDFNSETGYYVQIDATAFDDNESNSYAGISDTTTWNFTTIDTTNPTVSTLSPADDATSVAVDANLVITFNEAVDAETGNVTLYKSDDTQIQQFDVASDVSGSGTTTITMNPTVNLDEQTSYYIRIDATAFDDAAGNSYAGIADTTTWSFTTGDFTNPTIISISSDKANGSYTIGEVIDIDVTFSEAVTSTGDVTVTLETGDPDRICTFSISGSTTGTCNYTVQAGDSSSDLDATISGTIKDAGNNTLTDFVPGTTLATNKTLVIDTTAPTVSILSPADNAAAVAVDANLIITFSEAVDVEMGNVVIKKSSDDSTVETIVVTSGLVTGTGTTTITINPTADFEEQTSYYIQIDATAFDDAAGNSYAGIADTTTWNFTTDDNTAPIISSTSPSGEQVAGTTSATLSLTTDESATCKYSETSGVAFASMTVFATTEATGHSTTVSGLSNGNSYSYYVKCQDALNNESAESTISFSVANSSSGGFVSSPSATGSGQVDASVGMGQSASIGAINSNGVNVLTYINSPARFSATVSNYNNWVAQNHTFEIINFDLFANIVTIRIASEPKTVVLELDETAKIDLDNDGVEDIEIKFEDVYVNRAELTITSLFEIEEDSDNVSNASYENKLVRYNNLPKVYLVENNLKRWIVDENAFNHYQYDWDSIMIVGDETIFADGDDISKSVPKSEAYVFTRDLKLGMVGEDVKELQKFLNSRGFQLSELGVGSPNNETSFFGELTKSALSKFQEANNITPAVGYFGAITRGVIDR